MMTDETYDDMRDLVTRHRWIAKLVEENNPPTPGQWNWPQILLEAADEIERLRAENERLLDDLIAAETRLELWVSDGSKVAIGDLDGISCRDETIKILQNNNDALLADAKRYRWLKANHLQLGPDCWIRTGDDLDEATSEALKETS